MTTPHRSTYGDESAADPAPGGFPQSGLPTAEIFAELGEVCGRDLTYRGPHVFNSICSRPLRSAGVAAHRYRECNLLDNRHVPGLVEVERRVTAMLGALLGDPSARGGLTSGGTESNLLALYAAIDDFSRRTGRPRSDAEVLVAESAHYSIDKALAVMGVAAARARLEPATFRVDVGDLERRIGPNTAAIVVTAGTSECGAVDDVPGAAAAARRRGIWVHVDAATGGFLIPFLAEGGRFPFDFRVPGVLSIALDPHKYGYAPIPAGYLLFRGEGPVPPAFPSHYRGTNDHFTLLGTRPGSAVAAIYTCLRRLGWEGYRSIVRRLIGRRDRLVRGLVAAGFDLAFRPDLTVVGAAVPDPERTLAALEGAGMVASLSRRHRFLRLVVQRHQTRDDLDALVGALVHCSTGGRAEP